MGDGDLNAASDTPTPLPLTVDNLVKFAGMTREDAEFVMAVETGKVPGDVLMVDEPAA